MFSKGIMESGLTVAPDNKPDASTSEFMSIFSKGIPSTTKRGADEPSTKSSPCLVIEISEIPRNVKLGTPPGVPFCICIFNPGTRPCNNSMAFATGVFTRSSASTTCTEAVTAALLFF